LYEAYLKATRSPDFSVGSTTAAEILDIFIMAVFSRLLAVTALCFFALTAAHPGEHIDKVALHKEMKERGIEAEEQRRSYGECEDSEHSRARQERAYQRRAATVQRLREERGIADEGEYCHLGASRSSNYFSVPYFTKRNLAQFKSWQAKSHDMSSLKYTASTPTSTVFGSNLSCILTPDNANGPYYVLGEHIRKNVVEKEPGVPLHLEMQFVDVTNCKPLQPLVVDIWSCNATGIYSGVGKSGEGDLKSTFLRGVQETDADGVVEFDTIFPGHYQGRATHEHVLTHTGATILPNGTFTGGHISHLSQLFFDPALIKAVEASAPYNTNKIPKTSNEADGYTGYSATAAYDPFPNYIMLGSKLSDGIYAWIEMGVKPSNNFDKWGTNTALLAADGGHDNPKFDMSIVASPPPTAG
jgi:protocatechuate 3,4-dioxygenase beta subunit